MSKTLEVVKHEIFNAMKEQWDVPEFKASQLEYIDTISLGWRSHLVLATLSMGSKTKPYPVVVKTFSQNTAQQAAEDNDRITKLLMYFKREAGIWRKIGTNQHIAEVLGITESFQDSVLPAIITPYYPKQDLRRLVEEDRSISTATRLKLMKDVAAGLEYLHSLHPRVIHRDIKGSNILIRDVDSTLVACISDFGSAKFMDQTGIDMAYTTMMSSIQWTPPEYIIDGHPSYTNPTTYGDIWSFGCTFLEVLKGGDPWARDDDPLQRLQAKKHPSQPDNIEINESVWSIMTNCWIKIPEARLQASGIVVYMNMLVV